MAMLRGKRRRHAALGTMFMVGALGLRGLMAPKLPSGNTDTENESSFSEESMQDEAQYQRLLGAVSSHFPFEGGGYVGEEDYDAAFQAANEPEDGDGDGDESTTSQPLAPYTLEDALAESDVFESMFTLVLYDPEQDSFVALYNKKHGWRPGNNKMWNSMRAVVYMLREIFPERFTKDSPELVFALGSGDFPHLNTAMLDSILPRKGVAPVLEFGSAFTDPDIYTNMIAMPMPEAHHLYCFTEWLNNKTICKGLRPWKENYGRMDLAGIQSWSEFASGNGELVFGEQVDLEYNDLIPQVVWRGSDFGFLQPLYPADQKLQKPYATKFVPRTGQDNERRVAAVKALEESFNSLLPRWKGAALTARAEIDAEQTGALPWANMKFSSYPDAKGHAGKSPTVGSPKYRGWESVGIGAAHGMSLHELAKYKYHIDIGGGGGTTWSGTIYKLAMPGLLFHHMTPTKDYIHDQVKPWKHYIPIRADLADLKQKFDWAESHPEKAKRIADEGAEFMRHLATPEGFEQMFQDAFVEPLRRVIEAYQPVSKVHSDMASWRDVLESIENCAVIPVMECSGTSEVKESCHELISDGAIAEWKKNGYYKEDQSSLRR